MTLQHRAAELRDQGRRTAYAIGYATISDPARATHLHICLGPQWSGTTLYMIDLDSHKPGQNADAAKAAFTAERPELAAKLDWYPSKSGTGYHALFESHKRIDTGKLYDAAGNHIGELLGADSDRTLDPGNVRIPCLHIGEIERLLNVWHVKGSDPKGEQWKDRAKQGANWTRGYTRIHVTKIELRAHLKRNCGPAGAAADLLFDQREPFDRSAKFGNLVQTLMLHAHKLPGQQNTGFIERCTMVMAYAMASNAYGKADDKGYTFEKDTASLIAQIVNGDPYGEGRRWIIPFWAKGNTIATVTPTPAPEAPRPAHRPAGDRAKQITRFKRLLKHRWEDETTGRFYYFADDLDDWAARCGVSRRSIQSYLTELEEGEQIERGQEGGRGGRPWMRIKEAFFGMQISTESAPKAVPEADKTGAFWDADPIAESSIQTPETADSTLVCKEDHQNTCVPTALPDEWAGVDDEIAEWERTTAEGRHFAKLKRQQEATAEHIAQLCGVLRPAQRDLVSQVRKMARRVSEPDWWQRDYAAMDVHALGVELRRLQVLAGPPVGTQGFGDPLSGYGVQQALQL